MYPTPADYDVPIIVRTDKTLGYQYFMDHDHPLANSQGKVYYHRHLASLKIGRWLRRGEIGHHSDEDKANNVISNIKVTTLQEHGRLHARALKRNAHPCLVCGASIRNRNKKYCSSTCAGIAQRRVERPSHGELATMLLHRSMISIGKEFGVSDNAIRKWAKAYGLL